MVGINRNEIAGLINRQNPRSYGYSSQTMQTDPLGKEEISCFEPDQTGGGFRRGDEALLWLTTCRERSPLPPLTRSAPVLGRVSFETLTYLRIVSRVDLGIVVYRDSFAFLSNMYHGENWRPSLRFNDVK